MAKKKAAGKAQRTKRTFKLIAKLKSVSFKVETASVGVSVTRAQLVEAGFAEPLADLDALLTNAKLDVVLKFDPGSRDDVDGQTKAWDDSEEIDAVAEVAGFSVRNKNIGFTLKFSIGDVDRALMSRVSDCMGELTLKRTGKAKDDDDDTAGDSDDPDASLIDE